MKSAPPDKVGFDAFAHDYDSALQQGLSVSGEDKLYFAHGRVAWLARRLQQLGKHPETALDFGCGTGTSVPYLRDLIGVRRVIGVDVSHRSLAVARKKLGSPRARFFHADDYQPDGSVDLVFCNGVFHHIAPERRPEIVRWIVDTLRPGGLFALWENNPLNPGTRWVMSRIPFDREAITLRASQARAMLHAGAFDLLRTDYLFIFPRILKVLRFAEASLCRLPLGAQYQVLARKPG